MSEDESMREVPMTESERLCPKCGCMMEKMLRPPVIEDLATLKVTCPHHYVCLYCGHTEPV